MPVRLDIRSPPPRGRPEALHAALSSATATTCEVTPDGEVLTPVRAWRLGPGADLVVHAPDGPGAAVCYRVDHEVLGIPVDVARRAVPELSRSPLHDLFRDHLRALPEVLDGLGPQAPPDDVGAATTALARALILSAAGEHHRSGLAEALHTRIERYADQHLGEEELTPAHLAVVHNVSLRYLYVLFARRGETPAEWLWGRRLAAAQRALARGRVGVADVARRHGFKDASHFTRRFKAAYGVTPTEWMARWPER